MRDNSKEKLIKKEDLEEYLSTLQLSGVTERHIYNINLALTKFLEGIGYCIEKKATIEFLKNLQNSCSVSYYRKQLYQIKKFLEYYNIVWCSSIKAPKDPIYTAKRISDEDIIQALSFFDKDKFKLRYKAVICLCGDSGMRPEELYQLRECDIDLEKNTVFINHKPEIGQTTKTKQSRISFFTDTTKKILIDYLEFYNNGSGLKNLFGKSDIQRAFRKSPIRVKQLRKYFSQRWTRNNGNYQVKETLMGHSLRKSIDSTHYCKLSDEELKKVYDEVMNS